MKTAIARYVLLASEFKILLIGTVQQLSCPRSHNNYASEQDPRAKFPAVYPVFRERVMKWRGLTQNQSSSGEEPLLGDKNHECMASGTNSSLSAVRYFLRFYDFSIWMWHRELAAKQLPLFEINGGAVQ